MDTDFGLFRQIADNVKDERNVAARFYDKAVKTDKLTEHGMPIFKNVTYVEIRLKDNNTEVYNQPASKDKMRRFPQEYALYLQAKEKAQDGTPLELFAFLTAAEIATCKNRGIFTVENLARLDREKVKYLGLENEYEKARVFSAYAKHNRKVADFAERERKYGEQIAALKEKIAALEQQVNQYQILQSATEKGE